MSRRLKGWGCCGPTWAFTSTTSVRDEDDEEAPSSPPQQAETLSQLMHNDDNRNSSSSGTIMTSHQLSCRQIISSNGIEEEASRTSMNLAAALAAERQYRENNDYRRSVSTCGNMRTPVRASLMRLLEESRGDEEGGGGVGNDRVCCVCMGRKKGAAFIPCGHTFCRVCSREVWLSRGSCPLCNRSILEILDIF